MEHEYVAAVLIVLPSLRSYTSSQSLWEGYTHTHARFMRKPVVPLYVFLVRSRRTLRRGSKDIAEAKNIIDGSDLSSKTIRNA